MLSTLLKSDSFVSPAIAKKYDFNVPQYEGIDQIVEISPEGDRM
jgi:NAD(P)H-hydrate epimerase